MHWQASSGFNFYTWTDSEEDLFPMKSVGAQVGPQATNEDVEKLASLVDMHNERVASVISLLRNIVQKNNGTHSL